MLILFLLVFIASGTMLARDLLQYKQAADVNNSIKAAAVTEVRQERQAEDGQYLCVDHALLHRINEDYVGWIDVPGTGISYPVVYASDYEEYIRTSFQKEYLYSGTIFMDYRCDEGWTSKNTILYGHRMNDGSMFGSLSRYQDAEYLDEHKAVHVYRDGEILAYEVFAAYMAVAADESYTTDFADDASFLEWARNAAAKSTVQTGAKVAQGDRVLLLSTCKGGENDERMVVVAALRSSIKA